MNKWYLTSFVAISLLFFQNCNPVADFEDIDTIQYNAEYAVPIINSNLTIEDFLDELDDQSEIIIEPDGLIRFKYRGDVISATVEQMFAAINDALPPLIPVTEPGMALPLSSPDGIQIDYLDLKKGGFVYGIESELNVPVSVELTMPQFTKDGEILTFNTSLPAYNGSGNKPVSTNILFPSSLEGYTILPENDSVYIDYKITTPDGLEVEKMSNFFIRLQDLEFSYAEGFLGTLEYEGGRDTIEIDFLDQWVQGEVYFEDPTFTFLITNSFGIPTKSKVNVFEVFTVRQEKLPLESPFIEDGIDFPFPGLEEVGQTKSKTFLFDKTNSNIQEIIGAGPLAVDYDVDAITNPDGNTGIRGFITDESAYNVQVEVDLPLYGSIKNFLAFDTIDINLDEFDEVQSADFKLIAENNIPLEVAIQGLFLGENDQVIDSLFANEQLIIAGAPVDGQGNPTSTQSQTSNAIFEGDRFQQILAARKLILRVNFSTTETGATSVRLINTQDIQLKLGAILGVEK